MLRIVAAFPTAGYDAPDFDASGSASSIACLALVWMIAMSIANEPDVLLVSIYGREPHVRTTI